MIDTYYRRIIGDRYIEVIPLTFGRARLVIGRAAYPLVYDDGW